MEITGKLSQVLPEQTGQGRNGTWVKISFVLETQDQYPKKICIDAWGDKADVVKGFAVGDLLKVDFDAESREYNGRWYTNLKAWRMEKQGENTAAPAGDNPPLPNFEEPSSSSETSFEPTDDLPF
jgi:hypothetical protein